MGLNLLVKPFWVLGLDRVVQNHVGSAEYGIYFSLFNLSILFNIILDIGLTNFNNRTISQHNQLLPKYFSNIVVLKVILAFVYAFITILTGVFAGFDIHHFNILFLLIFNQFFLSFILYLRSNIAGLQKFKIDSIISILDRILMIIIVSVLLWTKLFKGNFTIIWFVYAQSIAYFFTALVAFLIVLKHANKIKLKFNKAFLISTIKNTFPFTLLVLFMSFYNRFDAVLLVRLLKDGDVQAGIYAQSFRLLDAASQFSLLFANLLLPIFSRMIIKKENVSDLVEFSTFLLLIPAIIFVIPSILYNNQIISLLYTEHNVYSAKVFAILISSFIPISLMYIFGTLITANGKLKYLNIIAFIGVVLNLSLNFVLIPKLKAEGSAISSLITQSFSAVFQLILALLLFKIKFKFMKILKLLVFILLFFLIIYLMKDLPIFWGYKFLFSIIIGLVLSIVLKLLNLNLMIRILKGYEK